MLVVRKGGGIHHRSMNLEMNPQIGRNHGKILGMK
jgi:hypothetical protein